MRTIIANAQGLNNSLQVSSIENVPTGDFTVGWPFLIKNITDDNKEVTLVLAGQEEAVTTIIYPGWNPELVKMIINAPNGLQIGY